MDDKFFMNLTRIDNISAINLKTATYSDLRIHYGTGVEIKRKSERQKSKYRVGIATNIGDIEVSVWKEAIRSVIEREGEQELFDKFLAFRKTTNYCCRTPAELEQDTLEAFSMRLFEREDWVDYQAFKEFTPPSPTSGSRAE